MDFDTLEKRLNSDTALREEFLKDPVRVFQREGLELGPEHAERLRGLLKLAHEAPERQSASPSTKTVVEVGVVVRW